MNKTELIEAIQQVIVPNGQKAITAESLANLLTEIVEAMGTGNGSGQVVFYVGMETGEDGEVSGFQKMSLTTEQKAHNAKMFALVKDANPMVEFSYDMSDLYQAELEYQFKQDMPGVKFCMLPATCIFSPKEVSKILVGVDQDIISNEDSLPILVYEDGSVEIQL